MCQPCPLQTNKALDVQISSWHVIISTKYAISQEGANMKSSPRVESSRNTGIKLSDMRSRWQISSSVFLQCCISPLSLLPAEVTTEQTQHCVRPNSPHELFIAPIPSRSERSLDISPSQRPPTGRVLCSEDPTASRYWLLCALLTPIMMSQECTGTKDQKISFGK